VLSHLQANTPVVLGLLSAPVLKIVEQDEELLAWLRRLQISLAVLLRMGLCTHDKLYRARAESSVISDQKGAPGVEKHLKRLVTMVCSSGLNALSAYVLDLSVCGGGGHVQACATVAAVTIIASAAALLNSLVVRRQCKSCLAVQAALMTSCWIVFALCAFSWDCVLA
jgi:hypothetical protein